MPVTDHHGSFGRSLLSLRREQVHSVEATTDSMASDEVPEMEAFQRQVADRFADLSLAGGEEILSLGWIGKLLDAFLFCQEEFRAIIHNHQSQLTKPPMDRLIGDYFDRSVKALDLCNAIREGIEQIKQWQKRIEIVINALVGNKNNQRSLGEGNFRRAKKALIDLAIVMQDEKESSTATGSPRNRSFGRNNKDTQQHHNHRTIGNFRSLSWSVSRSWSAARQLQAIGNNLTAPRAGDVTTTNGLAVPVYTMNSILLFVMWTLVAAIPCQDRGLNVHFCLPRHFQWAAPITSLHERILEESKKRGKKNVCGLLTEIYEIEKSSRLVCELVDSVQLPMTEEKESQLKHRMGQLVKVHDVLQESLDPLGSQVRDVFHRIVRIRTEGLHTPERSHNPER